MRRVSRGSGLLLVATILLFVLLAGLSAIALAGESRNSRVLIEYEADRLASALTESQSSGDGLTLSDFDPRILGFGLYNKDRSLASGFGDAPPTLDRSLAKNRFSYDESGRKLSLVRPLGIGSMGLRAGKVGPLQRAMRQMMPQAGRGAGFLYLSLDVSDYFRRRGLLRASAFAVPFAIAALALVFLRLFAINDRLRKTAAESETLARLGESARTLAHEIRNPLGAIRIQTGLVRQRLGGEAWPELDAIEEETERLAALSRRVSDFLKNPAGSPSRIELGPFLSELAERSPYSPRCSGAELSAAVLFDPELLRSVIDNLLRNASESYDQAPSAGPGGIELRLAREPGRALVSVLDRGKGISEESRAKVFDPFYSDKVQGSGVGLPLARRFVEAAGGKLSLRSREGGGTEALVSLPLAGEA